MGKSFDQWPLAFAERSGTERNSFLESVNTMSNEVSVTDVNMPFFSMVRFMVKWAVASIPALLIVAIVGVFLAAVLGGLFGGVGHLLR